MADLIPTYTFEGDEIFALHEGKVIASGKDMKTVEGDAVKYLDSLKTTRDKATKEQAKKTATHIVSPSGLKGEILGRVPDVWGEQVTARFENGQIGTFTIHGEEVDWVTERTASTGDPAVKLAKRLDADFEHDKDSLAARHEELRSIVREAHRLIQQGVPYVAQVKIDETRTAAEHEMRSVKEALDHLEAADEEAFQPPVFTPQVVEQADLGRAQGDSWLDVTTQLMIDEGEGQNYENLLREGPALFVGDLDTGALADAGVTREMALSHIVSKTASFEGEEVEEYRNQFIARVELERRTELGQRKEANKKEAAAEQEVHTNAPDDALFL